MTACLNLVTAVSIVLYDRRCKRQLSGAEPMPATADMLDEGRGFIRMTDKPQNVEGEFTVGDLRKMIEEFDDDMPCRVMEEHGPYAPAGAAVVLLDRLKATIKPKNGVLFVGYKITQDPDSWETYKAVVLG
jgi:hypothetical protein